MLSKSVDLGEGGDVREWWKECYIDVETWNTRNNHNMNNLKEGINKNKF